MDVKDFGDTSIGALSPFQMVTVQKRRCNKRTFNNRLEQDGAVIMPVEIVYGPVFINTADDDGGTKFNRDGTEAGRYTVVLAGGEEE